MESRSGREVIATQSSRPRKVESPMCAAKAAKTRPETPLSPSASRVPKTASASSTTTMTGPRARMVRRMRACWRSVSPTHLERNSPISMTGRAHSLAKQSMRKDLPTPTRPGHEDAAFEHIGLAVLDEPGQLAQPFLGGDMRGHKVEASRRASGL